MVNDSLFIAMATVLWAARLERAHDESGNEVSLDMETHVNNGMVSYVLVSPSLPSLGWAAAVLVGRSHARVNSPLGSLGHRHYLQRKSSD
jgi:hypothetical protein